MNKLYADRNGTSVDIAKQDEAIGAVNKLIERERQRRERSAQILDYYKDLKQKGCKDIGGAQHGGKAGNHHRR